MKKTGMQFRVWLNLFWDEPKNREVWNYMKGFRTKAEAIDFAKVVAGRIREGEIEVIEFETDTVVWTWRSGTPEEVS